jgi:hypothetical protein
MRRLGTAAIVALLAGMTSLVASPATSPAYAQMQTPSINLLQDSPSKSPEEREADEAREKAYKDSLKKIPEAKAPNDPWGGVRSSDAPKTSTTAKTSTAKTPGSGAPGSGAPGSGTPASAKKTKTGSNAN